MMKRLGWLLFSALAAFNVFAFASYEWSLADTRPAPASLVELAGAKIDFTAEERTMLEGLEQHVREKRRELFERGQMVIPRVREILLAPQLEEDRLAGIFRERLPDRIAYLEFENRKLHEALQKLPVSKREQLLDFLIELRVREIGQWANNNLDNAK